MTEKPQECEGREMWHRHFKRAYAILLPVGAFLVIFTERSSAGFVTIALGLIVCWVDIIHDIDHAKWHYRSAKKEDDTHS